MVISRHYMKNRERKYLKRAHQNGYNLQQTLTANPNIKH